MSFYGTTLELFGKHLGELIKHASTAGLSTVDIASVIGQTTAALLPEETSANEASRVAAVQMLHRALRGSDAHGPIRDAVLAAIAGVPREAVDTAIVDVFREAEILDQLLQEAAGYRRPQR
jgi:hypothetical protein